MRRSFIVIAWPEAVAEPRALTTLKHRLQREGWRSTPIAPRAWAFLRHDDPLPIRPLPGGRGAILGDLAARPGASLDLSIGATPARLARHLCDQAWGRYLMVVVEPPASTVSVFRDPSGALDAFAWRSGPMTVVASALTEALLNGVAPSLAIDWWAVHRQTAHPVEITGGSALLGVHAICPGSLATIGQRSVAALQLWTPAQYAIGRPPTRAVARGRLSAVVDDCLGAYAAQAGAAAVELSGGFDASLVAATLHHAGATLVGLINYAADHPSGDEQRYARALASHLDRPLTVRLKAPPDWSPTAIGQGVTGPRVSLMGLDDHYDRDVNALCAALGVTRLYTGQGGDAVFCQVAMPGVIVDRTRRLGLLSLLSPELPRLARWTRRSAWALIAIALRPSGAARADARAYPVWIRDAPPAVHPWLAGLEALPPAKRFQVENIAYALLNTGASRRAERIDLVHPLLSQPIVEYCLGLPVDLLVEGGRGRALARAAFNDRLPDLVARRRSKGELGAVYGRSIAAALPSITPFLMDGRLAGEGVLDRAALEAALDETHLAQHGGYLHVLRAVAMEAWVRHWEACIAARRTGPSRDPPA